MSKRKTTKKITVTPKQFNKIVNVIMKEEGKKHLLLWRKYNDAVRKLQKRTTRLVNKYQVVSKQHKITKTAVHNLNAKLDATLATLVRKREETNG